MVRGGFFFEYTVGLILLALSSLVDLAADGRRPTVFAARAEDHLGAQGVPEPEQAAQALAAGQASRWATLRWVQPVRVASAA